MVEGTYHRGAQVDGCGLDRVNVGFFGEDGLGQFVRWLASLGKSLFERLFTTHVELYGLIRYLDLHEEDQCTNVFEGSFSKPPSNISWKLVFN